MLEHAFVAAKVYSGNVYTVTMARDGQIVLNVAKYNTLICALFRSK